MKIIDPIRNKERNIGERGEVGTENGCSTDLPPGREALLHTKKGASGIRRLNTGRGVCRRGCSKDEISGAECWVCVCVRKANTEETKEGD